MYYLALCCLALSACTIYLPGSLPPPPDLSDAQGAADMMSDPPTDLATPGGPLVAEDYLQINLSAYHASLTPRTVALAPEGYRIFGASIQAMARNGHLAGTIWVEYLDGGELKRVGHAALWHRLGWDTIAGRPRYLIDDLGLRWSDPAQETNAWGVNSAGQVVGVAGRWVGISDRYHAFFYDPEVDQMIDLGQSVPSAPFLAPDLSGKIKWSGFGGCDGRASAFGLGEPQVTGALVRTEVAGAGVFQIDGACTTNGRMSAIRWTVLRAPGTAQPLSVSGVAFVGTLSQSNGNDEALGFDQAWAINRAGLVLGSNSDGVAIYGPTPYAEAVTISTPADAWHLSDAAPGQGACATALQGDAVVVADGAWEIKPATRKASRLRLPSTTGAAMARDITPDAQLIVGTTKSETPTRWRWSCPKDGTGEYIEAPLPDPGSLTDLLAVNPCGEILATDGNEDFLLIPEVAVAGCSR